MCLWAEDEQSRIWCHSKHESLNLISIFTLLLRNLRNKHHYFRPALTRLKFTKGVDSSKGRWGWKTKCNKTAQVQTYYPLFQLLAILNIKTLQKKIRFQKKNSAIYYPKCRVSHQKGIDLRSNKEKKSVLKGRKKKQAIETESKWIRWWWLRRYIF